MSLNYPTIPPPPGCQVVALPLNSLAGAPPELLVIAKTVRDLQDAEKEQTRKQEEAEGGGGLAGHTLQAIADSQKNKVLNGQQGERFGWGGAHVSLSTVASGRQALDSAAYGHLDEDEGKEQAAMRPGGTPQGSLTWEHVRHCAPVTHMPFFFPGGTLRAPLAKDPSDSPSELYRRMKVGGVSTAPLAGCLSPVEQRSTFRQLKYRHPTTSIAALVTDPRAALSLTADTSTARLEQSRDAIMMLKRNYNLEAGTAAKQVRANTMGCA